MDSTSHEESLKTLNDLLGHEFVLTHKGDELKGVMIDHEDGGVTKLYLGAKECEHLSKVFFMLALELAIAEH